MGSRLRSYEEKVPCCKVTKGEVRRGWQMFTHSWTEYEAGHIIIVILNEVKDLSLNNRRSQLRDPSRCSG